LEIITGQRLADAALVTTTVRGSRLILVIHHANGIDHQDPVMTSHLPDGQPGFIAKAGKDGRRQ
jgi:hypothetical protein